jgi:hypothetical protein
MVIDGDGKGSCSGWEALARPSGPSSHVVLISNRNFVNKSFEVTRVSDTRQAFAIHIVAITSVELTEWMEGPHPRRLVRPSGFFHRLRFAWKGDVSTVAMT